jgi:hypothetical protein
MSEAKELAKPIEDAILGDGEVIYDALERLDKLVTLAEWNQSGTGNEPVSERDSLIAQLQTAEAELVEAKRQLPLERADARLALANEVVQLRARIEEIIESARLVEIDLAERLGAAEARATELEAEMLKYGGQVHKAYADHLAEELASVKERLWQAQDELSRKDKALREVAFTRYELDCDPMRKIAIAALSAVQKNETPSPYPQKQDEDGAEYQ